MCCRCGSVDGAFGPVRNPWKYPFKKAQEMPRDHAVVQTATSLTRQSERGRQFHSSSTSESVGTEVNLDWHIAGGSSGGSAVSVATGAVFA